MPKGNGSGGFLDFGKLAAIELRHEDVVVPEWGDISVRVRELTATEVVDVVHERQPGGPPMGVEWVARAITPPGTEITPEMLASLGGKGAAAIQRLFVASQRLSAFGPEAEAEGKGGSPAIQPGDGSSGLH